MLTPAAAKALNINSEADLPSGGRFEKDASGKPTGAVTGGQGAIVALFDRLPRPTFDQQVEGTKLFFRELNRLGLTGVVDPGGNNLTPDDYQALFKVWRDGQMTVRVAYTLCGQTPGSEFEELKNWTALLPIGFGDDMLRFNGLGERITAAMNNNDRPSESDKDRYYQIVKWAADRGMSLTMHWGQDASVGSPAVDLRAREQGSADHEPALVDRPPQQRVGPEPRAHEGARRRLDGAGRDVLRRRPVRAAVGRRGGAPRAAGRDGAAGSASPSAPAPTRIASRPTIRSPRCSGFSTARRSPAPRFADRRRRRAAPTRCASTRSGSAWFSRDEQKRGSLEVGKLADLAVSSRRTT